MILPCFGSELSGGLAFIQGGGHKINNFNNFKKMQHKNQKMMQILRSLAFGKKTMQINEISFFEPPVQKLSN